MKKILLVLLPLFSILLYSQDHAEFIEGPFETPQEITETCLMCHEVAEEVMDSRHWNWMSTYSTDSTKEGIGKKTLINNFCIAVPSNYPRCTSCHISYGWKDETFDFTASENIDCLVCHEQTGTYKKSPTGAGYPEESIDLVKVAQSVGTSTRANCGACHFDGGGGAGVKHGDLDESLLNPSEELDVHMGGLDFQCTDCHVTENHKIAGGSHGSISEGVNHFACTDCHSDEPHDKALLNRHFRSVTCETCHVPSFAREEPTLLWWDWSKAGTNLQDSVDEFGKPTFNNLKGEFIWGKNVVPQYFWYDGSADYYQLGDTIDPGKPLKINELGGNIKDPNSKISPFKVMRGKQPFDKQNNYLIIPHLYGEDGYWKTFDWVASAEIGMDKVQLDFSGEVDFIETEMYWPIDHMVAPAKDALTCTNCHGIRGDHYLDWKALGYKDDPIKKGVRKLDDE